MSKRHRPGASATSVLRHVEEVVLATSGEDTFEIVFAVAAARIAGGTTTTTNVPNKARKDEKTQKKSDLRVLIANARRRYPTLEVDSVADASDELLARVDRLLADALDPNAKGKRARETTLDAVFESLVPRVSKSDKGQFFTPRHVVELIVQMLAPVADEVVVDPACGSGAFLAHARAMASNVSAHGCDVDPRAVRVARLLSLASGADPNRIQRADGLRTTHFPLADVIATNPPFAGRAPADGFTVAKLVRSPERDVLFLERAIDLLRPGGRIGIVLPYNKASGEAFGSLRRWLVDRARVLAIVGLPRETFLPHTSQRTFVLFAQKRESKHDRAVPSERTLFMISERAGKDAGGEPIFRGRDRVHLDHDLEDVAAELRVFLEKAGFFSGRRRATKTKTKTKTKAKHPIGAHA